MRGALSTVMEPVKGIGLFESGEPEEVDPRTLFVPTFGNATAFETEEGLLLVDCGQPQSGVSIHEAVRRFSDAPLHTVVFTHGHLDHTLGLEPWLAEGARPRIVAHRNVPRRFRRYVRTKGLQEHINRVQFGMEGLDWPTEFFWPHILYDQTLTIVLGGERFELTHAKGETDDATWVWAPERGILCTGDLWLPCMPNCGNPQKVQRFPEHWAEALEAMSSLGATVLLPGHGSAIKGAETIRTILGDGARLLRYLVDQTVDALNRGLSHEEIVATVDAPEELVGKPHLRPLYDSPEFIVRNVIRMYGGWWDGSAASLSPAPAHGRAREIASLAGGVDRLVARARELAESDLPLACHLAEWAADAEPDDLEVQECVRDLFQKRTEVEGSLMGRGIYMHAVRQAEKALEGGDPRA